MIDYSEKQKRLEGYKKALIRNKTEAEKVLQKELRARKIRFSFQKKYYNESFACILDFFIKSGDKAKVAVELDGGYHLSDEQKRKDK